MLTFREKISKDECRETFNRFSIPPSEKLLKYTQILLEFNGQINLTGAKTVKEFVLKHISDVWRAREALGVEINTSIIDVGSGGGLPGIVLAILSPATRVYLVERIQKKANALSQMVELLGLSSQVKVFPKSFEEIRPAPEDGEIWLRGFLPGPKLAIYLSKFYPSANLPTLVLMKGPGWQSEKEEIISQPGVSSAWRERLLSAGEVFYELPEDAGKRILAVV